MEKNKITFDVLKIDTILQKQNNYQQDENQFEFYKDYSQNQSEQDEKIDYPKYIAKISSNSSIYLGILSKNLKKESYGYSTYENGDEYFGQWNKDKKEGYGIYYFKDKNGENEDSLQQIYAGEFQNNQKSGEGIYFRISKLDQEKDNFLPVDFSLSIGQFFEDYFVKGLVLNIKDEKRKLYKGKLTKDGKKDDDNAEYYEEDNKAFHGIFHENIMIEGRLVIIKDMKKERGFYFNKKEEDKIEYDIEKDEKLDDELVNKCKELIDIFQYDKIKQLFIAIMDIKSQLNSPNNFDYMKNINYDLDIKQNLKELYGKWLYS